MAFFLKSMTKKVDPPKVDPHTRAGSPANGGGASARELAARIAAKADRRGSEPAARANVPPPAVGPGRWKPVQASVEVTHTNPELCPVLENAALKYASGQAAEARALLEGGIADDPETRRVPFAWLGLFDLLQRAGERTAFDRLALQYVVEFERSGPAWEDRAKAQSAPRTVGGYVAVTGHLCAASAAQLDGVRKAIARHAQATKLDLAGITGFDDAGARLLANALAEARRARLALQLQLGAKLVPALDAAVRKGREAGEGAWLLSLELLEWADNREAFEDRAVDFAVAFELSPPSWEPPVAGAMAIPADGAAAPAADPDTLKWSGVMTGSVATQLGKLADAAHGRAVVPVDMSEVERIDFVCAGALLNTITRIESQRKSVEILGASPIIRALLMLLGVAPGTFVRKAP